MGPLLRGSFAPVDFGRRRYLSDVIGRAAGAGFRLRSRVVRTALPSCNISELRRCGAIFPPTDSETTSARQRPERAQEVHTDGLIVPFF